MRNKRFIFNIILWVFLVVIILFLGISCMNLFSKDNESLIPKNMAFKDAKILEVANIQNENEEKKEEPKATTVPVTTKVVTKATTKATTSAEETEDEQEEGDTEEEGNNSEGN